MILLKNLDDDPKGDRHISEAIRRAASAKPDRSDRRWQHEDEAREKRRQEKPHRGSIQQIRSTSKKADTLDKIVHVNITDESRYGQSHGRVILSTVSRFTTEPASHDGSHT